MWLHIGYSHTTESIYAFVSFVWLMFKGYFKYHQRTFTLELSLRHLNTFRIIPQTILWTTPNASLKVGRPRRYYLSGREGWTSLEDKLFKPPFVFQHQDDSSMRKTETYIHFFPVLNKVKCELYQENIMVKCGCSLGKITMTENKS